MYPERQLNPTKNPQIYKPLFIKINMPEQNQNIQALLSDFNIRLRDLDEQNRLIKERTKLLSQNLLDSKEELEAEIKELKKQNNELQKQNNEFKSKINSILSEIQKFVKRDEILVIERMLKDFQPLEYMRKKDVEELLETKKLKTSKTTK